jgi:hypothetical protein
MWKESVQLSSRKSERAMKTSFKALLPVLLLLTLPAGVQAQFTFTTNNGAITNSNLRF